jgi:hypothetical protein
MANHDDPEENPMPNATTTPAKPTSTKAAKAAAPGRKVVAKSTAAKPRAPEPAARKDAPRKGDLTGSVLASYERVLAATPKAKKEAMNANAIARKLSDEAGKTVWPVPTKKHLETGVLRGDVVKVTDGSRVVYHLK